MFHKRKLNRLKKYDYASPGAYFVTINIKHSKEGSQNTIYLCEIHKGKNILREYGKIVDECWKDLPNHYNNCILDEYVIMPDHFHGIIIIEYQNEINISENGQELFLTKQKRVNISEIIRAFKSFSSRKINNVLHDDLRFEWQKSCYDRIIRNESEFNYIKQYIVNNPIQSGHFKNHDSMNFENLSIK